MARRLIWVAMFVGIALRLLQYLAGHPIWHDEWMLLWNIQHKTAAELMGKLEMNQGAPPLFLLTLRGLHQTLGLGRMAMRFPSLLAGCLSMLSFAFLARRTLSPVAAAIAVAAFALSDRLIWHSVEVKPYSIDVLLAIGIMSLAIGKQSAWKLVSLTTLATLGVWASYPLIFVFAGVVAALALQAIKFKQWTRVAVLILIGLIGLASEAVVYQTVAKAQRTEHLTSDWEHEYIPWNKAWTAPLWLVRRTLEMCDYPARTVGVVILIGAIVGGCSWWKTGKKTELGFVLLPILLLLLAAAMKKYPFGGSRATLFTAPGILLLFSEGVGVMWGGLPGGAWGGLWGGKRGVAWVALGVVLGVQGAVAAYHIAVPRIRTEAVRDIGKQLQTQVKPGDILYIVGYNGPWEFESWWQNRPGTLIGKQNAIIPNFDNLQRFWIVALWGMEGKENELLKQENEKLLQLHAIPKQKIQAHGGSAVLYERP